MMHRILTITAIGQAPAVFLVPTTFTLPKSSLVPLDFVDIEGTQHQVSTQVAFEVSLSKNIEEKGQENG